MDVETEALAADIICSLRNADLDGWTPPWCEPVPSQEEEDLIIWPTVVRGKRSRRRSSSGSTASGKVRWGRGSPASPLEYSGGSGSGSGASTSGGEDGGFCSPEHRPAPATKVGSIREPHLLTFATPLTRPIGQRPRKKPKLPEVQQLVRSLEVENQSLREEMQALQRACNALSRENDMLEIKLDRSNWCNENASKELKGKQGVDLQLVVRTPRDSFALPDLNLPPQEYTADVLSIH